MIGVLQIICSVAAMKLILDMMIEGMFEEHISGGIFTISYYCIKTIYVNKAQYIK